MNNDDRERVMKLIQSHAIRYNHTEKEQPILLKYTTSLTRYLQDNL